MSNAMNFATRHILKESAKKLLEDTETLLDNNFDNNNVMNNLIYCTCDSQNLGDTDMWSQVTAYLSLK